MGTPQYRNVQSALPAELANILTHGQDVPSRLGETVREVLGRSFVLERPEERFYNLPHRRNNPFAAIAETLWVLAGRNDIGWLQTYLPRARDFSDDGRTWRAGYGKRLRHWDSHPYGDTVGLHIDQVEQVISVLSHDRLSRRAVISLWDPSTDYDGLTKDVPCNNWMQFLVRNNQLHMHIAVRSNDAIWGWSGINAFEWSVLQSLVANSLGVAVGSQTYFIGSFHVYDRHLTRATAIAAQDVGMTSWYQYGAFKSINPKMDWETFVGKSQLGTFFQLVDSPDRSLTQLDTIVKLDPFLQQSLMALRVYQDWKQGVWAPDSLYFLEGDFAAMASAWIGRNRRPRMDEKPLRKTGTLDAPAATPNPPSGHGELDREPILDCDEQDYPDPCDNPDAYATSRQKDSADE